MSTMTTNGCALAPDASGSVTRQVAESARAMPVRSLTIEVILVCEYVSSGTGALANPPATRSHYTPYPSGLSA